MLTLESPAPPTEAVLILSLSRSACLPTAGAWLEATEAAEDPGLLARAPARRAPLPTGTWAEEEVDCIEVSTAELTGSEGA